MECRLSEVEMVLEVLVVTTHSEVSVFPYCSISRDKLLGVCVCVCVCVCVFQ